MRRFIGLSVVVGLAAVSALEAQAGGPLPRELATARYVAFAFDVGDALIAESAPDDARVLPDDRQALAALREEVERWGRYKVVARPSQAELVIAIRLGRRLSFVGGSGPSGAPAPGGLGRPGGQSARVETSSGDDAIFVYGSMSHGTPLWRGQQSGGLSGSPSALFERFRAEVERTAR